RAALDRARRFSADLDGLRAQAFAKFDEYKNDDAELLWQKAREREVMTDRAYGDAGRAGETAVMIDSSRADARGLLADVIYERALLAEREHRPEQVDELLARLALYDGSGTRRSAWSAPGHIHLDSQPAGAVVALERWIGRGWVEMNVSRCG